MLELRDSFRFIENKTLTGKKLIAGDIESNTYINVRREKTGLFKEVVAIISKGNIPSIDVLDDEHRNMANQMDAKGFFKSSDHAPESFNEISSFAKILFKKKFNHGDTRKGIDTKLLAAFFAFMCFATTIYIIKHYSYFKTTIDYASLSIPMLVCGILIMPCLVSLFHEAGHYIIAILLGIQVSTLQIGFFIIYPTVYLTYKGLNVCTTTKKILVLFGGILGHLFALAIAIFTISLGIKHVLIEIWLLVNVTMIFTNLSFLGVSDGYYILSSLVGVYNLRLLGYTAMKKMLSGQKAKKAEVLSGSAIASLWLFSFFGLYRNVVLYFAYFHIPTEFTVLPCTILLIILFARLIFKIRNLKI